MIYVILYFLEDRKSQINLIKLTLCLYIFKTILIDQSAVKSLKQKDNANEIKHSTIHIFKSLLIKSIKDMYKLRCSAQLKPEQFSVKITKKSVLMDIL